ncbi:MAG: type II secretion system protein [Candidatus Altimarinota bacterium]
MKNVKTSKGFTLIELLIVITIIGILAVALLPQVLGGPARARDAARKADLNAIVTALEQYAVDNDGTYPANSATIVGCVSNLAAIDTYFQAGDAPADPTGGAKDYGNIDCTGGSYMYCRTANNYVVGAIMENTNDNNSAASVMSVCNTAADGTYTPAAGTALYILSR